MTRDDFKYKWNQLEIISSVDSRLPNVTGQMKRALALYFREELRERLAGCSRIDEKILFDEFRKVHRLGDVEIDSIDDAERELLKKYRRIPPFTFRKIYNRYLREACDEFKAAHNNLPKSRGRYIVPIQLSLFPDA